MCVKREYVRSLVFPTAKLLIGNQITIVHVICHVSVSM